MIDVDIRKYFDSISHSHLRTFLDQRVTDGVIRRMIDKWLNAGAVENGFLRRTTEGSPQGGVISPCLSNVFLHHVLDEWFETVVKPRLGGESLLVRFADDAIMAFDNLVDAQRVLAALGKRLARFGLTLHSDKTRLVDFRPHMTERAPFGNGWDQLRLSRLYPRLGTVAKGQEHGQAGHGQKPLRARGGRGERLVSEPPTRANPRPASPLVIDDAGPLRLLRRRRQHSTIARVRPSSGANMAKVVVSARSPRRCHLDALQRTSETPPVAISQGHPRIRRCERISLMKNRMREFRSSGSARDGAGNVPIYSALTPSRSIKNQKRIRIKITGAFTPPVPSAAHAPAALCASSTRCRRR